MTSRLEALRAEFQKPQTVHRLYKRLPCERAGGNLAAEYRLLTMAEVNEAITGDDVDLPTAAKLLGTALVQLHYHAPEDSRADPRGLVPLHIYLEQEPLGPLGFDKRLVDLLELPVDDHRSVTIQLLLFDDNELALGAQSGELSGWSSDTANTAYQDFTTGS